LKLKKFISVKITEGCEMTAGEFNKIHPEGNCKDRNPEEPGYLIKYLEGDGYESWCPKDVHESRNFEMKDSDGTKISEAMVIDFVGDYEATKIDEKTTLVKASMKTGFTQYEVSSCVDPKNYDQIIGSEIASKRIKDTAWKCLGFVLQWGQNGLGGIK